MHFFLLLLSNDFQFGRCFSHSLLTGSEGEAGVQLGERGRTLLARAHEKDECYGRVQGRSAR